jgi:hypothetical protein
MFGANTSPGSRKLPLALLHRKANLANSYAAVTSVRQPSTDVKPRSATSTPFDMVLCVSLKTPTAFERLPAAAEIRMTLQI